MSDIKTMLECAACADGAAWLRFQPDVQTAWQNCMRADWMVWALRQTPDGSTAFAPHAVEFAHQCAMSVIDQASPDAQMAYAFVLAVREAYARGESTRDDLEAWASEAAWAAARAAREAEWAADAASPLAAAGHLSDMLREMIPTYPVEVTT